MTIEEFHKLRKPFYLDNETLLVKFPSAKNLDKSHAEWFSNDNIPYLHTLRGYYMPINDYNNEEYLMIYSNDFEIPNMVCTIFVYLFDYFPNVKWIGVGCDKSEEVIWKPKLKITRNEF